MTYGKEITVTEFKDAYGIRDMARRWAMEKEVSDFLHLSTAGGIILADVLAGDGLRDQISPELLAGFQALMKEKVSTADDIREILIEKLMYGNSATLGLINKIKGQVGENVFAETARQSGFAARLADSGSQEAWDVAITPVDAVTQYIQVKTMSSSGAVIDKMKTVAEKVAAGKITDGDTIVQDISFAVPNVIYEEVVEKVDALGLDTPVLSFGLSADDAAQIVRDGFDNVGIFGLGNFFNQLAGGTLTALTLHTLVQMFLLSKGAKEVDSMLQQVGMETGYSAGGIGAAMTMEAVISKGFGVVTGSLPAVAVVMATGLSVRGILRRVVARHDYAAFMHKENNDLKRLCTEISSFTG